MAAFGDKIQALMDEFYAGWQKEENKGKGKWDVLGDFSEAHQIAVVFGNFNYQVENGGLEQWVYNGYFHDDAEKFIGYLETGAELDERCRTILDRVYKLDQYANETGCDRYGYYHDPDDDGDSSFIGDLVNCDAFDTWYYERCGKDDWWATVSGIIDKTEGREVALSHDAGTPEDAPPLPDNPENANTHHPFRVYVENVRDERLGGFTMPLPATAEELRPFLDGIEIKDGRDVKVWEVSSDSDCLNEAMAEILNKPVSSDALDELNYLAAKIDAMQPAEYETFGAALEAKRHCGSVAELINLTDNLGRFDIQPAYTPEMYGAFLLETAKDETFAVFDKLKDSANPDERAFAQYVLRLEAFIDETDYGRGVAQEEDGVFTSRGYLTEGVGFKEAYRGPEDIPAEYRVVATSAQTQEKTADEAREVIAPGIKSDEMLGRYLYDNKMLSEKEQEAANARLSFTAYPEDYYRSIGRKRREAGNGSYTQDGYVESRPAAEKPSVLERIAADRAERAAAPKRDAPEKPKSREPEL